jgi:hypothetical protein
MTLGKGQKKILDEDQKERLSQAFKKLLELERLREFSRLWGEEGQGAAMSYLGLSNEDVDDFREYLQEVEPPDPSTVIWYLR